MIGIKIANGEFYPILGEDGASAKRLVLTTVKDDQQTVHIDLYRGEEGDFANPSYLGSLVIDGISGKPKQVPDIELTLSVDDSGELVARASDRESGASRSLTVSLTQAESEPEFTIPDFELDAEREADEVPAPAAASVSPLLTLLREDEEEEKAAKPAPMKRSQAIRNDGGPQITETFESSGDSPRRQGLHPAALVAIILAALAVLLLLGFLIYKLVSGKPAGKPEPSPTVALASPEPSPTAEPSATPAATPQPSATPKTASGADQLGKNGSKGLTIRIVWGDTLWDLATRYYGNPWLYKKIAKANKIRNPDLIIAGRKLWIPPR